MSLLGCNAVCNALTQYVTNQMCSLKNNAWKGNRNSLPSFSTQLLKARTFHCFAIIIIVAKSESGPLCCKISALLFKP